MSTKLYLEGNDYILAAEELSVGSENLNEMEPLGQIVEAVELPDEVNNITEESFKNSKRTVDRLKEGQKELDTGNVTVRPTSDKLFYWLLGDRNGSGNPVLSDDGSKVSFTVQAVAEKVDGSDKFVRTFNGVIVQSGTITASDDDDLTLDLDLIAQGSSTDATKKQPRVTESTDTWQFADAQLIDIDGVTYDGLQNLTIDVENNADYRNWIGSDRYPDHTVLGVPSISADLELSVENTNLYEELINPTDGGFSLQITFDNGTQSITIVLTGCKIEEAPHPLPEEQEMQADVSIIAKGIEVQS